MLSQRMQLQVIVDLFAGLPIPLGPVSTISTNPTSHVTWLWRRAWAGRRPESRAPGAPGVDPRRRDLLEDVRAGARAAPGALALFRPEP